MIWIETNAQRMPFFRLNCAYLYEAGRGTPRWVLLKTRAGEWDQWYGQVMGDNLDGIARLQSEKPSFPDGSSGDYAIALMESDQHGTVYEVGWQKLMANGTSLARDGRRLYFLRDPTGTWAFLGEGPEDDQGKIGGRRGYSRTSVPRVVWAKTGELPCNIEFVVEHRDYEILTEDDLDAGKTERRNLVLYDELVLDGGSRRLGPVSPRPFLRVAQGDNLGSLIEHLSCWTLGWEDGTQEERQRIRQMWRDALLRLNPSVDFEARLEPETKIAVLTYAETVGLLCKTAEPVYRGKSLSEWILRSDPQSVELLGPKDFNARPAVRHIGTNALPWLLRWISSDQPKTAHLGIRGLELLGPESSLAVPTLNRLVEDWRNSSAWSNAIAGLEACSSGTPHVNAGFPSLLAAATNVAAPSALRLKAIQSIQHLGAHVNGCGCLANLGANAPLAVPVLIRCLQDPDSRLAAEAAYALGSYTIEPALSVGALAAALESRTNSVPPSTEDDDRWPWRGDVSVRFAAASGLRDFAEVIRLGGFPENLTLQPPVVADYRKAVQAAIPSLVRALRDGDSRLAWAAASALGEAALEPELVVPALIESLGHTYATPINAIYGALYNVPAKAAEALGRFGSAARPAVPALIQLERSGHWAAAREATEALRRIGPSAK